MTGHTGAKGDRGCRGDKGCDGDRGPTGATGHTGRNGVDAQDCLWSEFLIKFGPNINQSVDFSADLLRGSIVLPLDPSMVYGYFCTSYNSSSDDLYESGLGISVQKIGTSFRFIVHSSFDIERVYVSSFAIGPNVPNISMIGNVNSNTVTQNFGSEQIYDEYILAPSQWFLKVKWVQ
jgi:hypothetical protein